MKDFNWDYADLILRHTYPQKAGWLVQQGVELGEFELDYVFTRENSEMVLVLNMEGAYVGKDDIKLAKGVLTESEDRFGNQDRKVILMYGKLLFPPERLPSNITVVSASEDVDSRKEGLTSKMSLN